MIRTCNICQRSIPDVWIDGKTRMGPWATMCEKCHKQHGVGLGTGKGQKFASDGTKLEG